MVKLLAFALVAFLYLFMVKGFFDQGNSVCGILLFAPPLYFIYAYFVELPNLQKLSEEEKIRKEKERIQKERDLVNELERLDYSTLIKNGFMCSICGGGNNVIVVDSSTFVKSKERNSKRIVVCAECQIDKVSPRNFEMLVGNAFARKGYDVVHKGGTGDGGIDLICTKGEEFIVVQCKHYKGTVGISAIRDFYGTVLHSKATKGYFVTTGFFPSSSHQWVMGKPIELVAKNQLANLLVVQKQ